MIDYFEHKYDLLPYLLINILRVFVSIIILIKLANDTTDTPPVVLVDLIEEISQLWRDQVVFVAIKEVVVVRGLIIGIFLKAHTEN